MKRLVEKTNLPILGETYITNTDDTDLKEMQILQAVLKKIYEYEEAEEQGLLLRMPATIGNKVYAFCKEFGILEYEVDGIVLFKNEIIFQCSAWSGYCNDDASECLDEIEPNISDFGKDVFLTREEAEQKLKEMEVENETSRK